MIVSKMGCFFIVQCSIPSFNDSMYSGMIVLKRDDSLSWNALSQSWMIILFSGMIVFKLE